MADQAKTKRHSKSSGIITFRLSGHVFMALQNYAAGQLDDMGNILSIHDAARKLMFDGFKALPPEAWREEHTSTIGGYPRTTPTTKGIAAKKLKTLSTLAPKTANKASKE